MMSNDFQNKLMQDIEQLSRTLKGASAQASAAINGIEDEQLKAFFTAKLSQAMSGKLDIETFLKQVQEDAQTAKHNKQ